MDKTKLSGQTVSPIFATLNAFNYFFWVPQEIWGFSVMASDLHQQQLWINNHVTYFYPILQQVWAISAPCFLENFFPLAALGNNCFSPRPCLSQCLLSPAVVPQLESHSCWVSSCVCEASSCSTSEDFLFFSLFSCAWGWTFAWLVYLFRGTLGLPALYRI